MSDEHVGDMDTSITDAIRKLGFDLSLSYSPQARQAASLDEMTARLRAYGASAEDCEVIRLIGEIVGQKLPGSTYDIVVRIMGQAGEKLAQGNIPSDVIGWLRVEYKDMA